MLSRLHARLALILCSLVCASKVSAVVIAGGDGTNNTTSPADDFGFANVGMVFNTADGFFNSGVYLGNGWVLCAYHPVRDNAGGFLFGPVIFNQSGSGGTFTVNPATAVRLHNADNSPTDLALFQLEQPFPSLPAVRLAAATPTAGPLMDPAVRMAGFSLDRDSGETHWNVTSGPGSNDDVWTETAGAGTRQGYKWGVGGQTLRWGDNTLEFNGLPINRTFVVNAGFGAVTSIKTDFDTIAGHAQGAAGDSGGGVFYKNGADWELLGIMHTVDRFDGQPANTAVYGNATYAANIPTYRGQILAIIPEPSVGALAVAGILVLWQSRRRV